MTHWTNTLPNFIFDIKQHKSKKYIDRSALLVLEFSKDKLNYSLMPIFIDIKKPEINIELSMKNQFDGLSDFSRHDYMWGKECFRVLCVDDPLDRLNNNILRNL